MQIAYVFELVRSLIFKIIFVFGAVLLLSSCKNKRREEVPKHINIFPKSNSRKSVELIYDSTKFRDDIEYDYFESCEVYFSDDTGNVWRFHVYQSLGSMHGYKLYDKQECSQYKGARFYIEWDFQGTTTKKGNEATMSRIEELMLKTPEIHLKRRLVKLKPGDDIVDIIGDASAGDSIVLGRGIYYLSEGGLSISSDYVSLTGEPGSFIFANIDYNVIDIDAHSVKISNLNLSHINSENAACSGDVILINSFSCSRVTIENCDINGCGVVGINLYATDKNNNINYSFSNNFIHNNSGAAIMIDGISFDEEVNDVNGISFQNNVIWNNGEDKINEPFFYKNVFTFGQSDSVRNGINIFCPEINVYHFDKVEDKLIPFHGKDSALIIGYINPAKYSGGKAKGILVYERFKPIEFFDTLQVVLCDSTEASLKEKKLVIVYRDKETIKEYFEQGGEDWSWFVEEVWGYFEDAGAVVKNSDSVEYEQLTRLIKKHNAKESGMGYFFVMGKESAYFEHNLPHEVKKLGDGFFKENMMKQLGLQKF